MKQKALLVLIFFIVTYLFSIPQESTRRICSLDKNPHIRGINVQTLETNLTPQDLMNNILGSNVSVSNLQYTGANIASGVFTNGLSSGISIDDGIILSCGSASYCIGPNESTGASYINSVPGDPDLDTLIPGYSTNDASILEFDFVPQFNVITFNYIFASEEYPEWVGSNFNDVFGFFLDGENIAIIPGTNVPVAINNINQSTHSEYYVANHQLNGTYNIEADGFTVNLSVRASVNPGQSHHIKLAIADAGDYSLDSWIFLEASSLTSYTETDPFSVDILGGVVQETNEDIPIDIPVTVHGLDNSHFYWVLSNPIWGSVEIIEERDDIDTKIIRYTPNENYNGYDSFVLAVHNMIDDCIFTPIAVLVVHQNDPPACSLLPSITGNFQTGETVTCDSGLWNDDVDNLYVDPGEESTIQLIYQWQRFIDDQWMDIPGANSAEYLIENFCLNLPLHCRIYAQDDGTGMGGNNTSFADSNEEIVQSLTGIDNEIPAAPGITNIYPNPFNPDTRIDFYIETNQYVLIQIYNPKGQIVKKLLDKYLISGTYALDWNGCDNKGKKVTSGIYFVSFKADGVNTLSKISLLK